MNRRRPRSTLVSVPAALLLALGAAACAGTTPTTGTPGTAAPTAPSAGDTTVGNGSVPEATTTTIVDTIGPKACQLLTKEQVQPVLGFEPVAVQGSVANFIDGGYNSLCVYRHPDDPDRKGKLVRVLVFPPGTDVELSRRVLEQPYNVVGLTDVFVGRAPEDTGSGPNTIVVNRGTQAFSITVVTGTPHTDADLVALVEPAMAAFTAAGGPAPLDAPATPNP